MTENMQTTNNNEDTTSLAMLNSDVEMHNQRKDLYRRCRNEFRSNSDAMVELAAWKNRENDVDYNILYCFELFTKHSSSDTISYRTDILGRRGLMIEPLIDNSITHPHPFQRSDTFFSEFKDHNDESLILSETLYSYIIGNRESHDERQYPTWANSDWKRGISTPAGMVFGHCLVIPKERLYNIVDPDAVAWNLARIKEMKDHFTTFWNKRCNREKLLARQELAVQQQNSKLVTAALKSGRKCYLQACDTIKREVTSTSTALSPKFLNLTQDDFVFVFHPSPYVSVGHLHMHVLPVGAELRKVSSKIHDWKSVTTEAIHAVEQETPYKSYSET